VVRPNGNVQLAKEKQKEPEGSKILLSRLPVDVGESEIEELFKKTVGPLKESFIIYNSQGKSKGMAVVSFQRGGDAALAHAKYDGKIVDGRRPIKIEIISNGVSSKSLTTFPQVPSLFSRLGIKTTNARPLGSFTTPPTQPRINITPRPTNGPVIAAPPITAVPPRRLRQKKGPRRTKKSRAQLDQEMEDYRAGAGRFMFKSDDLDALIDT
jgi:THO complex subunit 4